MVRDGRYPRGAPLGYYNDLRTKTIKIDRKTAPIVREAFELYARGDRTMADIADFLQENGAIGRRLDFLCQELGREANTLCAKAQALNLTRIGLELKAGIEQFREQVQNLE